MRRPILSLVLGLVAAALSVFAAWGLVAVVSAPYEPGGEIAAGLVLYASVFLWLVAWIPGVAAMKLGRSGDSALGVLLGWSPGLAVIFGLAYAALFK